VQCKTLTQTISKRSFQQQVEGEMEVGRYV